MLHALSIDVEDWYHDGGAPAVAAPAQRVEQNTQRLFDIMAAHGATGTLFFLGEVAERFPGLVRRAVEAGHEIGSHGYTHRPVMTMTRREFRADVARSLRTIEDAAGRAVRAYRAPYFSIKADVRWPIEILADLGVAYDASVLAIDRPPGLELITPRRPYRHANGLWEVPVAVLQIAYFWYLPLASGSGMRLLPRRVLRRAVRRFERQVGAGVFYLHPWELDRESPAAPGVGRWLIRAGRGRLATELAAVLKEFRFAPIATVFPQVGG